MLLNLQLLRGKRVVVVFGMEGRGILKVDLQGVAMVSIDRGLQYLLAVVNPLEASYWHWLTHGPSV